MSLLMDALKQAEHAKRGKQPDTTPPETPAAYAPVYETPTAPVPLSLAPVETPPQTEMESGYVKQTASVAPPEHAVTRPDPPSESAQVQIESVSPTAEAAATAPVTAPHPGRSTGAAARILAASESRLAAQRQRNRLGMAVLGVVLTLAIGGYYYYATLAQTQPYIGPAQLTAVQPTPITGTAPDAVPAPARDEIEPSTSQVPAHTPWQPGPEPATAETQSWEPAPVDPGVVRGEPPLMAREAPEAVAVTPPAASAPGIRITRGSQANKVSGLLLAAYDDYRNGRWTQAERSYREVLAQEPNNRDARLGLAALAVRAGQLEVARLHYRELLRRNPKDAAALAALTDLSQTTVAGSESELKLGLAETPQSAQLHFALANLYASEQRWPLAQQSYFEAQRLAPGNPDYAFNLAISLEHLGQPKHALNYYRRALQLAGTQPSQFDAGIAQQRIAALELQINP